MAKADFRDFVWFAKGGVYVKIRVSPGAKSTAVKGSYGEGTLKLSVAAPPTHGKANAEVQRYLADLISVERSRVTVAKGKSSRDKLLFVSGAETEVVREGLVGLVR